jgi:nucleoside-diphosphate-sugar epimerase
MNILVTGGSGRIGRYVMRDLVAAGHNVTNADIASGPALPGGFLRVDLTDPGDVYQALAYTKSEAVVHLGAWADAGKVPDTRTYGDNVRGAYNVFQACADLAIQRIIYASSAQVYGFAHAAPAYAPVDEDHPLRPCNSYALAKVAAEDAAAYFIKHFGLNILSFRFMGVRMPSEIAGQIDAMTANPASGAWLLWTRLDARDAARACRLAIEAASVPSGPYNITGPRVVLEQSTAELVATYFGEQTKVGDLPGNVSPLSITRAKDAFGYQPQYAWSQSQHHPDDERAT